MGVKGFLVSDKIKYGLLLYLGGLLFANHLEGVWMRFGCVQKLYKLRWETLLFPAILLISVYSHEENYWRSVWFDKWALLLAALSGFLGIKVARKSHWVAGLFITWILWSALWAFGYRNAYPADDMMVFLSIGKVTAYTFSAVVAFVASFLLFEEKDFVRLPDLMSIVCLANAAVVLYQRATGVPLTAIGGILGNPSMSGALIAFTLPMVLLRGGFEVGVLWGLKFVILCGAILLMGASQPILLLMVALFSWAFAKDKIFRRMAIPMGVSMAMLGLVAVWALSHKGHANAFTDSGRLAVWRMALENWWYHGRVWFGQGTGVSQILVPLMQRDYYSKMSPLPPQIDWWFWLHSDWIQTLFENGIVGMILALGTYGVALLRSYRRSPWLFSSVVTLGVSAVANFPAHWPIHAFFGSSILVLALRKGEAK